MSDRYTKIALKLVHTILIAVLFVPLLHWSGFIQGGYVSAKMFSLEALIQVAAVVWVFIIVNEPWRLRALKTKVFGALGALFAVMLVTLPFSTNISHSLWSNESRMMGIVGLVHLFMLAVIAVTTIRDEKEWKRLFAISFAVSVVIALIGALQYYQDSSIRASSTIGNQSLLSSYLVPHLVLGGFLWLSAVSRRQRMLTIVGMVSIILGIFSTGSRAGVLSLGLCVFAWMIAKLLKKGKGMRIRTGIAIAMTIGVVLSPVAFSVLTNTLSYAFEERNSDIGHLFEMNFGADRLMIGTLAVRAIAERPIVGWGFETFDQYAWANYDVELWRGGIWAFFLDRTHNVFLDFAYSAGIGAALAFAAVCFFMLRSFVVVWRRKGVEGSAAGIMVLVAFTIILQLFFLFIGPAGGIIFFLVMGYASRKSEDEGVVPVTGKPVPKLYRRAIVVSSAIVIAFFMNVSVITPAWNLLWGSQAFYTVNEDPLKSITQIEAVRERPSFLNYRIGMHLGQMSMALDRNGGYISKPLSEKSVQAFNEYVDEYLDEVTDDHPDYFRSLMIAAHVKRIMGQYDPVAFDEAESIIDHIRELAPLRWDAPETIGEIRIAQGRYDEAVEAFDEALQLMAGFDWNVGRMYLRRAEANMRNGKPLKAFIELSKTKEYGLRVHDDIRFARAVGDSLEEPELRDLALGYITVVADEFPGHPVLEEAFRKVYGLTEPTQ